MVTLQREEVLVVIGLIRFRVTRACSQLKEIRRFKVWSGLGL